MADYQQAPNFSTYNFKPYQLPGQQLMDAVNRRTSYWLQGAQQVKSAYEQATNLDLSHQKSKDKLNAFMSEAEQQLQKASKSDLSVGQNVSAAMKIFKPIYQDRALMLDDQITKFYKAQSQVANN